MAHSPDWGGHYLGIDGPLPFLARGVIPAIARAPDRQRRPQGEFVRGLELLRDVVWIQRTEQVGDERRGQRNDGEEDHEECTGYGELVLAEA